MTRRAGELAGGVCGVFFSPAQNRRRHTGGTRTAGGKLGSTPRRVRLCRTGAVTVYFLVSPPPDNNRLCGLGSRCMSAAGDSLEARVDWYKSARDSGAAPRFRQDIIKACEGSFSRLAPLLLLFPCVATSLRLPTKTEDVSQRPDIFRSSAELKFSAKRKEGNAYLREEGVTVGAHKHVVGGEFVACLLLVCRKKKNFHHAATLPADAMHQNCFFFYFGGRGLGRCEDAQLTAMTI